jgi:RND family efflux transporter MFP subunit
MNKITKISIFSAVILVIIAGGFFANNVLSKSNRISLTSNEVGQGNISKKINLIGQVKASQGVDMSFEGSGKITANYVKVGDKITAGQALISIDSSILQAQLNQAKAQLAQAKAQANTISIETTQSKADSSLQTARTAALAYAQKSVTVSKNSLMIMTDIQYNHFMAKWAAQDIAIEQAKAKAAKSLLGAEGAGGWTSQALSMLNGGAYGQVQTAINSPTPENIDTAINAAFEALKDTRSLIDAIPLDTSVTTAEKASIVAEKSYISGEIITLSNAIQAISAQKVNNDTTMTTTSAQIEAANASVQAIEANIQAIQTQISKTTLRALFNGQVDKDDAIVGALAVAGAPVITISNNNLEIQVSIPESQMANIKVGNIAEVTLDAFGNNQVFKASVVSIDTAPTMENGIAVYKARLKFEAENEQIKSGMTANVTIISETRENVVMVPNTAVIQKTSRYFVIVDKGVAGKENREVNIGIKDDKNTEIVSGLQAGEKVISY